MAFNLEDNGGKRSGIERRRFSYSDHIPERRSGEDRRKEAHPEAEVEDLRGVASVEEAAHEGSGQERQDLLGR
jgi:hypothetical protein